MNLAIDALSVSYGSTEALSDFTLDVSDGERFAIMGPSGSGKSTLLRAVAGLIPSDSGTIVINGIDMTNTPAHRRPVGLMFQDYALFPHMDVVHNVAYGLRMEGVPAQDRMARSRDLLDLVGLPGFENRVPTTLSGGEQQRVALARTLAPEPSVILLDEPLASLDFSLRQSLLAEMRAILDAVGATSIYVTHDSSEAFAFGDRMAVMREGEIVRMGAPDEIWYEPRSEFVASAIGQSNLVPMSTIGIARDGVAFVPLDATTVRAAGQLSGVVVDSRFEDGARIATLAMPDGASRLDVQVSQEAIAGVTITFDVDQSRIIVVSASEV
ncbi:MAG: ABC transporter ATP-binding protein [Actinomycetia bacterium]|nr:ABC transporter ATP-binding protein [Actinomycetes bacterium]